MAALACSAPTRTPMVPSHRGAATRKRILVVDDDPVVLQALCRVIGVLEADVQTASDPERGLALFASGCFDLVIADERMPKMSGLDMLTRVRAAQPRLPTILLTGHADPASFIRAYERCGVFRYLTKPWDNMDLIGTVREALKAADTLT